MYRLANSLTHRERRCAAPGEARDRGIPLSMLRKRQQAGTSGNEAGADAAALECQGICETVHSGQPADKKRPEDKRGLAGPALFKEGKAPRLPASNKMVQKPPKYRLSPRNPGVAPSPSGRPEGTPPEGPLTSSRVAHGEVTPGSDSRPGGGSRSKPRRTGAVCGRAWESEVPPRESWGRFSPENGGDSPPTHALRPPPSSLGATAHPLLVRPPIRLVWLMATVSKEVPGSDFRPGDDCPADSSVSSPIRWPFPSRNGTGTGKCHTVGKRLGRRVGIE